MRSLLLFSALLTGCASALPEIPPACLSGAAAASAAPADDHGGRSGRRSTEAVRIENGALLNGDKVLAGPFVAIDSFDVSQSRREVVFSAKRTDSFDVGLVALEGSAVNWVPPDPADEVGVQWAPRGNKVSYIVRARGGDIVRTVHIPTSMQLAVTFPWARITSLTWDMPAERYTVVYSTPDATGRSEVARYGGEERGVTVAPASRLDVTIEPLGPDAIVLRPNDLRYDERLPVVIWLDSDLYAWSEARAALIRNARVAVVVSKRDDLQKLIAETPWLDATKQFLVTPNNEPRTTGNATTITAGKAVPAGRYRREGRVVAVPPALVQSFAACYIADQLKRTSPTNGSSR